MEWRKYIWLSSTQRVLYMDLDGIFNKYIVLSRKWNHTLFTRVIIVASSLLGKMKFIFQDLAIINHYTKKGQFLTGNLAD